MDPSDRSFDSIFLIFLCVLFSRLCRHEMGKIFESWTEWINKSRYPSMHTRINMNALCVVCVSEYISEWFGCFFLEQPVIWLHHSSVYKQRNFFAGVWFAVVCFFLFFVQHFLIGAIFFEAKRDHVSTFWRMNVCVARF